MLHGSSKAMGVEKESDKWSGIFTILESQIYYLASDSSQQILQDSRKLLMSVLRCNLYYKIKTFILAPKFGPFR